MYKSIGIIPEGMGLPPYITLYETHVGTRNDSEHYPAVRLTDNLPLVKGNIVRTDFTPYGKYSEISIHNIKGYIKGLVDLYKEPSTLNFYIPTNSKALAGKAFDITVKFCYFSDTDVYCTLQYFNI